MSTPSSQPPPQLPPRRSRVDQVIRSATFIAALRTLGLIRIVQFAAFAALVVVVAAAATVFVAIDSFKNKDLPGGLGTEVDTEKSKISLSDEGELERGCSRRPERLHVPRNRN